MKLTGQLIVDVIENAAWRLYVGLFAPSKSV